MSVVTRGEWWEVKKSTWTCCWRKEIGVEKGKKFERGLRRKSNGMHDCEGKRNKE
jgi:hypothetical protein